MPLISLACTSLACTNLQPNDLEAIHATSRELNARDEVSGILVYNGTHFLQVVEGPERAIDDLVERLRRDSRHTGFEIRDRHRVSARSFPEWPMELVRVNTGHFEARQMISDRLPDTVAEPIRLRLLRMTELISKMEFPD